jgi:hypothetical protein
MQRQPKSCGSIPATRLTARIDVSATFKKAEDAEHYFEGLRKAGCPKGNLIYARGN